MRRLPARERAALGATTRGSDGEPVLGWASPGGRQSRTQGRSNTGGIARSEDASWRASGAAEAWAGWPEGPLSLDLFDLLGGRLQQPGEVVPGQRVHALAVGQIEVDGRHRDASGRDGGQVRSGLVDVLGRLAVDPVLPASAARGLLTGRLEPVAVH